MTMVASGNPISLGGTTQLSGANESLEFELQSVYGSTGTAQISLNDSTVRSFVGIASGAISLGNFYGLKYYVGNLYAWGQNNYGQLGQGNRTSYSSPKQVGALITWSNVLQGLDGGAVLGLKTDGTLWAWGDNAYASLGLNNTTSYSSPKQVGALTNWAKIASSAQTSAGIKTDGSLWLWGNNYHGECAQGTGGSGTNISSPKQVGSLNNWLKISGGQYHFVALKTDGTLWSWGYNVQGQLGLNNNTNYSSPMQIGALTTWNNVYCIGYATFGIQTNGTIWSWGQNNGGQLGLSTRTNYQSPNQIGALTNWSNSTMSANGYGYHATIIKSTGNLWVWGQNNYGQLGLNNTTYYSSPKQVGALTNWLLVASGGYHTVAVKTDGTLWSWGKNATGQLGFNNTTYYSSPKQMGSKTSWTAIGAGYYDSYGISST